MKTSQPTKYPQEAHSDGLLKQVVYVSLFCGGDFGGNGDIGGIVR